MAVDGDQHHRDEVMSRNINWAVVGDLPHSPMNDDKLMIGPVALQEVFFLSDPGTPQ